jgi:hypothetical protein
MKPGLTQEPGFASEDHSRLKIESMAIHFKRGETLAHDRPRIELESCAG